MIDSSYKISQSKLNIFIEDVLDSIKIGIVVLNAENIIEKMNVGIKNMFGYKKDEVSSSEIQNSINNSQLTKFVSNLKNGLETKVGERGVKISGGEKQRIGIARALYNNPEILVFDEATSNLDLETESKILEILLNFKMKKTIIFITHRESGLNICDRVFRIENNAIKEIKTS